jgi:hypothetical protein
MRLEGRQYPMIAFLQQRLVFGGSAKNRHARNLPTAKFVDLFSASRCGFGG